MIVVKEIEQTCEACPSQWEGYSDDGRSIYVRYRWGFLSVRIGSPGDKSEFAGVRGKEILHKKLGDSYHGFLSYEDLVKAASEIIQFP
jgi:hypothetical protein